LDEEDRVSRWSGGAGRPEERLEVLEQRRYVQSLFQARKEAESLPDAVWLLWSGVTRRLASQQRQLELLQGRLEAQQKELDTLKQALREQPSEPASAAPDAFQQWMADHRAEVGAHRGRHIAVHAEEGIVASAESYASLVDELERRGVPDHQVVIEFIPPAFSIK
jgi:hypothetical protein